eukprot:3717168-Pyramimonas_sp.AAC.1
MSFGQELLLRALSLVRHCHCAPLRWHVSRGVPLPRPDGKSRWIHLLDPLGKAWAAGPMRQRGPLQASVQDHGFLQHRRREGALIVQNTTGWWLEQRGLSYITNA